MSDLTNVCRPGWSVLIKSADMVCAASKGDIIFIGVEVIVLSCDEGGGAVALRRRLALESREFVEGVISDGASLDIVDDTVVLRLMF